MQIFLNVMKTINQEIDLEGQTEDIQPKQEHVPVVWYSNLMDGATLSPKDGHSFRFGTDPPRHFYR